MKKILVIANWKCNPTTQEEAKKLFYLIKRGLTNIRNVEIVICPPFLYLHSLNSKPKTLNPKLGAQNCFWEDKGSFTGEISAKMLKNLGCRYVILGHSEREKYFGETDEMTNKKIKAAISAKLNPILCVGETKKEKRESRTYQVLKNQLEKTLQHFNTPTLKHLIIAYEPIWAVGTGTPCPSEEARIGLSIIRRVISNLYNPSFSQKIKIIYGGSINSKIAKEYIQGAGFQGILVGGASLNPSEFLKIIKKVSGA